MRKLALLLGAAGTLALASTASAASGVLLGDQSIAPYGDSNNAGVAQAFQYTATASGTTSDIELYTNSGTTATQLQVAVYGDAGGKPGSLLASGTLSSPKAGAWNDVPVTAATITQGQAYWIALLGTGGTVFFPDTAGGSAPSYVDSNYNLSSLPQTYAPGHEYNVSPASAYVNASSSSSTGGGGSKSGPLLGNSTVQSSHDGGQGTSEAFGYTATTSGTATSISVYLDTTDGVSVGLYADSSGRPGSRLAQASVSSNPAGWVTVPLSGGPSLTSGTRYWVAIAAPSSTAQIGYRDDGTSGSTLDYSGAGLANPYSVQHQWNSNPASVYVSGAASSSGTTTTTTTTTSATSTTPTTSTTTTTSTTPTTSTTTTTTAPAPPPPPPAPPSAPANTAAPSISGSPIQGQTLTVSNGQWSGSPTTYSYQWSDCDPNGANCTSISGATNSAYTLAAGDVNHTITATVTATNSSGSASAAASPTAVVTATGAPTYYVADNGSDSNNGTSKTTPWQHAPGMKGCTANCAAYTPRAGVQIILKGGDSWDYTGANGVVGLPWVWSPNGNWNGTSSSQIYIGVDKTWYDGSSWSRPKLNGDNPLSTATTVGSCANPLGSPALDNKGSYVTFDNLEFLGYCYQDSSSQQNVSIMDYGTTYSKFLDFYYHGWTVTGVHGQNIAMINGATSGPSYPDTENQIAYSIFDGSDSSPQSGTGIYGDCYYFDHNYMRDLVNNVCNDAHDVHDNVFEYFNEDRSNGVDHGNTWETNTEANGTNYFYDNVIRHIGLTSAIGVNLWLDPPSKEYFYNNVMYDVTAAGNNYLDIPGPVYLYNNTLERASGVISCDRPAGSFNNLYMNDGSSLFCNAPSNTGGDMDKTVSAASDGGSGYTAANQYAPTAAFHPTAGAGLNEANLCASLPGLCNDTTLAVGLGSNGTLTYPGRTPTTRPTSGAWDVGAYNYQ